MAEYGFAPIKSIFDFLFISTCLHLQCVAKFITAVAVYGKSELLPIKNRLNSLTYQDNLKEYLRELGNEWENIREFQPHIYSTIKYDISHDHGEAVANEQYIFCQL